ncbi:hypothetical protein FRC14_008313 [Serendipita sp. 396]|nr:hypothetical protein FRC14_008313 [Serendipita sp. 396]KAG8799660.1 hypothetical protein FRC16_004651 [Serendipita sp. 398]
MRSSTRSSAVSVLLGSTLVYAMPHLQPQALNVRAPLPPDITVQSGGPAPDSSANGATIDAVPTSSHDNSAAAATSSPPSQPNDTFTENASVSDIIKTATGSTPNSAEQTASNYSAFATSSRPTSSAPSSQSSLVPQPPVGGSSGKHGALTGVVVGGLIVGLLLLTLGLWLCYRRRGPNSGASTPRYTIPVADDEKPRSKLAFWRSNDAHPGRKGHHRVKSSQSFASPMIDNEPKMIETPSTTLASSRAPLAPHLGGNGAVRDTWNGRWSTFSTSDGSAYPQTPVGTSRLSGIIMETVVETDALPSSAPRTPIIGPRGDTEYFDLRREPHDAPFSPNTSTTLTPKATPVRLPPLSTNRLSSYGEEDQNTPTTPTSSGAFTFGSGNDRSIRTSDQSFPRPALPVHLANFNGSNPVLSGSNASALLATRPKFNPTYHSNGSSTLSYGKTISSDRDSSSSQETAVRITNPFLDDDEDMSSYGHGIALDVNVHDYDHSNDDSKSLQSMDSDVFGAHPYPSSAGCVAQPSPSPESESAPITRPRSSLISDASSDCPYPMGYAVDANGNVANPFLRISELLEEVDGRMRWPSPPLIGRSESRNY